MLGQILSHPGHGILKWWTKDIAFIWVPCRCFIWFKIWPLPTTQVNRFWGDTWNVFKELKQGQLPWFSTSRQNERDFPSFTWMYCNCVTSGSGEVDHSVLLGPIFTRTSEVFLCWRWIRIWWWAEAGAVRLARVNVALILCCGQATNKQSDQNISLSTELHKRPL